MSSVIMLTNMAAGFTRYPTNRPLPFGRKLFLGDKVQFIISLRHKGTSSRRWMDRQSADPYTKKSVAEGYRSRAAYKLLEIDQKFKLFNKSAKNIVDLGFAPGAWTQVALNQTAKKEVCSKILGVDLINCAPPPGSFFIQGDIFSRKTHNEIERFFSQDGVHLILSDMMCNSTGNGELDHFGSMDICEGVLVLVDRLLERNGAMVMKYFSGSQDREMRMGMEKRFKRVFTIKPQACRSSSRELYVVGLGKKNDNRSDT